jgi:hypothetical protein
MARLKTQNRGLVEWFELHQSFDVGPASIGSARLLENPLNGPVMRIAQDQDMWKVLAFPGTGYDIRVDDTTVHAGSPRILAYGASIRILRGQVVKFEAIFEDKDQLELRAASLEKDVQRLRDRLAERDRELEQALATSNLLEQGLAASEQRRDELERELSTLRVDAEEHLRLVHAYALMSKELQDMEQRQTDSARDQWKFARLREICRAQKNAIEELHKTTRQNRDRYLQDIKELEHRYASVIADRDRVIEMYNGCAEALRRLTELHVDGEQ